MCSLSHVTKQYLACISVNIISMTYGCVYGWTSASYVYLIESNHFESGRLNKDQLGWVTAAIFPGSILGALFFGWLADKIGRKRALLCTAVPMMLHWLIILFARNVLHLTLGRLLAGTVGGACFTVIPIYVTELAENKQRSTLGTFMGLSLAIGTLLISILGYFFHYITVAWIMLPIPLVFLVCFSFNPETPQYLGQHNMEKAEKSLRYYRGISPNDATTEEFSMELSRLCKAEKSIVEDEEKVPPQLSWADFFHPKARKAYFIGLGLVMANQLSGCLAMMNYTTVIFKEAGSNLSPMLSTIIISIILLLGSYCSTLTVERAGRKTLLLISISGICLGECTMASYYYLTSQGYETSMFDWIPLVSFSFILLTASCGVLPITIPVIAELTPPKIRSIMIRMHTIKMFCMATIMVKLFPMLTVHLGIPGVLFMYASSSLILTIFIAIFVPETKGKTIEAIQDSL